MRVFGRGKKKEKERERKRENYSEINENKFGKKTYPTKWSPDEQLD